MEKLTVTKPTQLPRKGQINNGNDKMQGKRKRRNDLYIATWNVRTLLKPGKMNEIIEEVTKTKVDILALQEIRWKSQGIINKQTATMYFSCNETQTGMLGTGFLIKKNIRNKVISFEPINDRICKLRIKGKFRNITLISAHAPTEEKDLEEKERFYDLLEEHCEKTPKYDTLILLGDFNAKIGKEDFLAQVAGKQTLHETTNENGKMLAHFAMGRSMVISSTYFEHKNIHKGTWKSPDNRSLNQIDHVLINKRQAASILDVRTYRGPNCDSDHFMVQTTIREKISNISKTANILQERWNTSKFKQESEAKKYKNSLDDKLVKYEAVNNSVQKDWDILKKAIAEAAEETIGKEKRIRNEDWFDEECKQVINIKNNNRMKMLNKETRGNIERYVDSRKRANAVCKRKKREMLKRKVEEIEEQSKQINSKMFYKTLKNHTREYQPRMPGIKDKQGRLITDEQNMVKRWEEYFCELLNNEDTVVEQQEIYMSAQPNIEEPTVEDVINAINKMKTGKAPGFDAIRAELFKNGSEELIRRLHSLILNIWKQEGMPEEWSEGIIQPILKKGDRKVCSNYRGITLLNVSYKIFSSIVCKKLTNYSEEILGDYQCGFRPNRSTTDQIFTMRQCMETAYEYNRDLHILFIDFKQAYDSISRSALYKVMERMGIPTKLINLVKMTLENVKGKVRVGNKISEQFNINTGVKQGDALSALLFNLALHSVIEKVENRGNIAYKAIQICAYADDIAVVTKNVDELKEVLSTIVTEAKKIGLLINAGKTKYMKMSAAENRRFLQNFATENQIFEGVKNFTYLGEVLNNENQVHEAVQKRIQEGNKAFYRNRNLMKSKLLTKKTKLKIYKTLIRPVATYGSETWTISKKEENDLLCFERKIMRKIYGPVEENGIWRRRYNFEINDLMEGESIVKFIKSQRLRWLGHVQRMSEGRLARNVMYTQMHMKRKKGRPRKKWKQQVEEDLRKMGVNNWKQQAVDRSKWKEIVKEAKVHTGL